MSTWTEDDKRIATRALKTLEQASVASRGVAIYYLEPVRREMGIKRPDDIPERSDAWLAVCREALAKPDRPMKGLISERGDAGVYLDRGRQANCYTRPEDA